MELIGWWKAQNDKKVTNERGTVSKAALSARSHYLGPQNQATARMQQQPTNQPTKPASQPHSTHNKQRKVPLRWASEWNVVRTNDEANARPGPQRQHGERPTHWRWWPSANPTTHGTGRVAVPTHFVEFLSHASLVDRCDDLHDGVVELHRHGGWMLLWLCCCLMLSCNVTVLLCLLPIKALASLRRQDRTRRSEMTK